MCPSGCSGKILRNRLIPVYIYPMSILGRNYHSWKFMKDTDKKRSLEAIGWLRLTLPKWQSLIHCHFRESIPKTFGMTTCYIYIQCTKVCYKIETIQVWSVVSLGHFLTLLVSIICSRGLLCEYSWENSKLVRTRPRPPHPGLALAGAWVGLGKVTYLGRGSHPPGVGEWTGHLVTYLARGIE